MDSPDKFHYPPIPREQQVEARLVSKQQVIDGWSGRAKALGYQSVAHMLQCLEQNAGSQQGEQK